MMNLHLIRGITAVALLLTVVPFFSFIFSHCHPDVQVPPFSTVKKNSAAIEIITKGDSAGIYFVGEGYSLKHLFRQMNLELNISNDFPLKNTMSLTLPDDKNKRHVIIGKMTSAKRLALGLPININQASFEDLILVPGIGPATAEKIVSKRDAVGQFKKIEELTKISGIKEKKLSKLTPYLCIE